MTPTEQLDAHHEKLIVTIRNLADRTRNDYADTSLLLSYCNEYLLSHAGAEEVTLYKADNDADFINHMIHGHREIAHSLEAIANDYGKGDSTTLASEVERFMGLLDKHFAEEENTLMPKLSKRLAQQELESLIMEAHQIEAEKKKSDVRSLFEYDHKRIDVNISRIRNSNSNLGAALQRYSKVRSQLLKHIELEETVLFAAFAEVAAQGQMGPVQVMIAEHREITSLISPPADSLDEGTLASNVDALIGKLAVHNKKEEMILYPLINRTLPRNVRDKLFKECFDELFKT
ncbi:MAG: hemerythrin domain-containing protein [Candidatus Kryptoniota bacterium]